MNICGVLDRLNMIIEKIVNSSKKICVPIPESKSAGNKKVNFFDPSWYPNDSKT